MEQLPGLFGVFLGALVLTFLVSRLFLFILTRSRPNVSALLPAHACTVAAIMLVAGVAAQGSTAEFMAMGFLYILAALVWLGVDSARKRRRELVSSTHKNQ